MGVHVLVLGAYTSKSFAWLRNSTLDPNDLLASKSRYAKVCWPTLRVVSRESSWYTEVPGHILRICCIEVGATDHNLRPSQSLVKSMTSTQVSEPFSFPFPSTMLFCSFVSPFLSNLRPLSLPFHSAAILSLFPPIFSRADF